MNRNFNENSKPDGRDEAEVQNAAIPDSTIAEIVDDIFMPLIKK